MTRTRAVPTGSVSCCRRRSLFLLVLALLRGNEAGWSSRSTVLEFTGAAVLLAAFLAVEARIAEPMLPLKLFSNRSFTGIQLAAVGISSSLFAIFVYLTFYFQGVTHLSPIESGLAYLPGTVLSFVVAGASASFVTKIDSRVLLTAGLGLVAVGMALGLLVTADSSWTALLPSELVAMFGCGIVNPVLSGLVLSTSPEGPGGPCGRRARHRSPRRHRPGRCRAGRAHSERRARDRERRDDVRARAAPGVLGRDGRGHVRGDRGMAARASAIAARLGHFRRYRNNSAHCVVNCVRTVCGGGLDFIGCRRHGRAVIRGQRPEHRAARLVCRNA